MGPLGEACKIYGDPELLGENSVALLAEEASLFLRAGGAITLAEFGACTPIEKATLAAVGDQLASRQAVLVARAARSAHGEAQVLAEIDGGDSLIDHALADFLDRTAT